MTVCGDACSVGDIMLVDGGLSTLKILSKSSRDVHMEVVDGGKLTSRRAKLWMDSRMRRPQTS